MLCQALARWAKRALPVALVLAVALSVIVLLAAPHDARASRPEQTGAYQVMLWVGAGSTYSLPAGGSVTLPIRLSVTGAVGLASASVLVKYDPLQLEPIACEPQAGSPGGFCNIAYDPEHGLIRFNVLSDAGLLGEAGLFDLVFAAASTSTLRTEVAVTPLIESITDLQGNTMTSWAQGSMVQIAAASGEAAVYVGAPNAPVPLSITRGLTTSVPIMITGVTGLGSASFSLAFNPAVARPIECLPVQHPEADGVCALHDDHVAASLLSQSGLTGTTTDPITAFVVVFTTAPIAVPDDRSSLDLMLDAFADTSGDPIPVRMINNALKVSKTGSALVPMLRLDPVAQYLNADARVAVHVFLDRGGELAAGTWGIRYDPLVVQAEACQTDPSVANAMCNPAAEPGLVRMTVLGLTATGAEADLPADLGSITFRRHPQAKAEEMSSLAFEVTNFANALGEQLPCQTQGAQITLALELDLQPALAMRLIGTPPYQLTRGASLDFPVSFTVADPTRAVANLTGSLHFDPLVLRPTRCVLAQPTPDGPTAFCNAQYDTKLGIIRFALFDAQGFSGTVTPFVLTFEAASTTASGKSSPLHFTVEAIGGPLGEPRTWAATDETVTIELPVPGPRVLVGPPGALDTETYTVTLGSSATAPLWVENVTNLGAGTIEVRYDPTVARATRCTVRSDLTPELDGGFCSLLPGIVRFAFVASQGIAGSAQIFDIVFAQAPNAVGGMSTPLNVVVLNFVDIYEYPIPTTVRDGSIAISALRITKTANPTHVPETGGSVTFTFLAENIGQAALTLNSLVDTKFGNLAGKGTCTVPRTIAAGGSTACQYAVTLASDSLTPHTNVVSASATDSGGKAATDVDDATVTFDDVAPAIRVTKTGVPTSVLKTGGDVTFTYAVTNDSGEAAEIIALGDDKFGALAGDGDCQVGTILPAGASCAFKAVFRIPAGEVPGSHVDVFSATVADDDDNTATASESETIIYADVLPDISVLKTGAPTAVPETGGEVRFTYAVTNQGPEAVTISLLSDDRFGALAGDDDCRIDTVLAIGARCSFEAIFAIPAGDFPGSHTNLFTTTVTGESGKTDSASDAETIAYTDVAPSIAITKTSVPGSVPETGGDVTFTYRVENQSGEAAEITALGDDKYGALAGDGDCRAGTVLAAGAGCDFAAIFAIPAGDAPGGHTNTFSATVTDGDGNSVTATEPETIAYTDVAPSIAVTKTGVPTSVPKTGGNVTFTYLVTKRGTEAATITALSDDKFGALAGDADCGLGAVLAVGATCDFAATFAVPAGTYPGSHTNVFSATAADDDGSTATATDPETIAYTEPNQPGGKILPTGTTCQQYRDGTAGPMYDVQYTLKKNKIGTVNPGVFFYYSSVRLPSGSFVITVPQHNSYTDSTGSHADVWPDIPAQSAEGIILWDPFCNRMQVATGSYDPVADTATISGVATADIYYVSVKYSPSAAYVPGTSSGLVGYTVPAKSVVTYTFQTWLKSGGGAPTLVPSSEATQLIVPKR